MYTRCTHASHTQRDRVYHVRPEESTSNYLLSVGKLNLDYETVLCFNFISLLCSPWHLAWVMPSSCAVMFCGKKKSMKKITLYNNVLLFCFCCAQLFTFEKKHGRINFYSVLAPFLVLSSGLVNEKFVTSNYVLGRKAKIQNHAKVE